MRYAQRYRELVADLEFHRAGLSETANGGHQRGFFRKPDTAVMRRTLR
jgi:hypothetical protein